MTPDHQPQSPPATGPPTHPALAGQTVTAHITPLTKEKPVTATLETTATPTIASNDNLAEAFTELAGLISARAHLPAITYGVVHPRAARPAIDLWVAAPEHVAVWAETFDAQTRESESTSPQTPFTVTEATIPGRSIAELTFTHLRYHDQPATTPDLDAADDWAPSTELVRELADRVADEYGASARLTEIGMCAKNEQWPEVQNLDDGQTEELFEEIRDLLASRDTGRRR